MAITNKDVDKIVERMKEVFETKEDAHKKHDEVMQSLDALMKEKETAREDRVFAKAKDDEQDREISDLKNRVKKVEEKVLV
jgi:hypothetical protein